MIFKITFLIRLFVVCGQTKYLIDVKNNYLVSVTQYIGQSTLQLYISSSFKGNFFTFSSIDGSDILSSFLSTGHDFKHFFGPIDGAS